MRPVALLTDFGLGDVYAGVLHAVLEREAPGVRRIDLGHGVPAGDVWAGCWGIRSAWRHLPDDAVVLAVVDPGVGTDRRAVAARVGRRWVVAPDNGLIPAAGRAEDVVALDAATMRVEAPSSTFHGRDLFAPAAARLARDDDPAGLGPELDAATLVACPIPAAGRSGDGAIGVVAHVDRFGNVISTLPTEWLGDGDRIRCGLRTIERRVGTYGEIPDGEVAYLAGSDGTVEVAARGEAASAMLSVERGDPVELVPARSF